MNKTIGCLLPLLLSLAPVSSAWAQRAPMPPQFAPSLLDSEQSVTASLTLYCGDMTAPYLHDGKIAASGALSYELDAKTLFTAMTMALTSCTVDFTLQAVYWPLFGEDAKVGECREAVYRTNQGAGGGFLWNAGVGAVGHFRACEDIFNETDLLMGVWTRGRWKYFEFNANADYMLKSSRIHAIDRYVPRLVNNSLALGLQCKWHILPWRLSVWGSLASWDAQSFMLFFAPRWTAGAEWEALSGIFAGVELTAVYIDQATLSAYCEGTQVRCFIRWSKR